jgi:hypothetical protein
LDWCRPWEPSRSLRHPTQEKVAGREGIAASDGTIPAVCHARFRRRLSIGSGVAGTNLKKTARYAGENFDPLHFGSLSDAFLRPPPFCRIGRRARSERSGWFFNSAKPTAMARLETPLARATSDMPPRPWAVLSAAAHNRRVRSSSQASNWEKRSLISPSLATRTF